VIPLTATVITFNEEDNIRDCLESLEWVDNIVVVDSGSTDRTIEIAREFTDRVVVTDWPGHLEQKNRAVDLSPTDWVISLDADERVTPALRTEIEEALATEPLNAGFSMPRLTWHLGRWIRHGGWYPDRKIRLFDRRRARWGGVNPHDRVIPQGPVTQLRGDIEHYTYRSLHHHLETIDFFTSIAAREKEKQNSRWPLLSMITRPPFKFFRMYILQSGWRDGFAGFILAGIGALYVFLKYARLWERRSSRKRQVDPDSIPTHHRGPEWRAPRILPPAVEERDLQNSRGRSEE